MATQVPTVLPTSVGTIAGLLRTRARDQPDQLGYTFLVDGETEELRLTYGETNRRARAVAASLREAGVDAGARAILVMPPGLDYVTALFGCFYAGVVAVPVYPPDPFQLERSLPRLRLIIDDAAATVALTSTPLLSFLDEVIRVAPELGALRWLAVDAATLPADHRDPADEGDPVPPGTPALLQYTSGSTSAPRGVMLTHTNLLHNSGLIQDFFHATADSRGLVWLPPYHDMGLIGGLLQPLYGGFPVTLMSPLHFLEQPLRWLRAIHRDRATVSGGPNFAYDLCARKADSAQVDQLDLSSWRVAFNGAEPIRPETLRHFAETFAPAGFRPDAFLPCYGLAEATLIVCGIGGLSRHEPPAVPVQKVAGLLAEDGAAQEGSGLTPPVRVDRAALERHVVARPTDLPAASLTVCGPGASDQAIIIVDPATHVRCLPDRVGEIWVSGPSVAAGYWGRPEETAQVFGARLADGGGPFLRTGDLGFLHDGQLVVTGRLKDLIIVRGRNHYPQDIELAAERADPLLRPGCTAAFVTTDERLVLVHEVRRSSTPVDVAAVTARVRQAVAQEQGLQVHAVVLIRAGGMPKTSSGKVQRRRCRDLLLAAQLPEIGRAEAATASHHGAAGPDGTGLAGTGLAGTGLAGTGLDGTSADASRVLAAAPKQRAGVLESYLRGLVAAIAGADRDQLDPDAPLLAVGLDSLAVVQLKHRLETDLGVVLSLSHVLAGATLAATVEDLVGQLTNRVAAPNPIPTVPTDTARELVAPMSYAQRWLWFLQQLELDATAHIIAVALRLPGPVNAAALRRAVDTLVARHPILRTTFPLRDGEPVQLVAPVGHAAYQEHQARQLDDATLGPVLVRAARRPFDLQSGPLLRLDLYHGAAGDVLLVAVHHIITDFWSLTVLARELGAYYAAYTEGRELTRALPAATYVDFTRWQLSTLDESTAQVDQLTSYWQTVVADGLPKLSLPAIEPRAGDCGGARYFTVAPALARRLRERAAAEKATLYVLLLAAFQVVLHRLTGQHDLVVGTNAAARTRPEFAEVVGCCTNSVMIRSRATAGEPFRALLARTRQGVIGALQHQEYPPTLLAARLGLRRGSLFDVLFSFNRPLDHSDDLAVVALLGPAGVERSLGGLRIERFPLPAAPGTLPIELTMGEVGGVPHGLLRYRGDALDAAAADRLVARFVAMLEEVAADPAIAIGELDRFGEGDRQVRRSGGSDR